MGYFRCYSPVAFGKKSDPEGLYIRKYLPQLKHMPKAFIYEPWKAPRAVQERAGCLIGQHYPPPIVTDHVATSKENMAKMKLAFEAHKRKGKGGDKGKGGGEANANSKGRKTPV